MPPGANLGFIYFSDRFGRDAPDLVDYLKAETGIVHWVGSTGVGVMGGVHEYMEQPALALLVGALPPGSFSVFSGKRRAPRPGSVTASGAAAASFAVVHGDPETEDVPALLQDMAGKVESGFLAGGLSSAMNARAGTLQVADDVIRGGLSGVVFSADIAVATRLTQGCLAVSGSDGTRAIHRVTEGERNIVAALDGRPALDVLRDDLEEDEAADWRRVVAGVAVGLPVPHSDTGDYMVRNLVGVDPRNKLIAIGAPVEIGMQLMFCRRGGDAARLDLTQTLSSLRAGLAESPRAGLYFSCLGRGQHMFGEPGVELRLIREALGEFPLVGFFANGEISHDRLYAYTGVLLLFT